MALRYMFCLIVLSSIVIELNGFSFQSLFMSLAEAVAARAKGASGISIIAGGGALADEAKDSAKKLFPNLSGRDDTRDAYRHCLWNCLMAQHFSSIFHLGSKSDAKIIADNHEAFGSNKPCASAMDLFNNAIGRGYGFKAGADPASCVRDCFAGTTNGDLQLAPKTKNGTNGTDPYDPCYDRYEYEGYKPKTLMIYTRHEAQTFCETKYNADLGTILTKADLECVFKVVGDGESPWIDIIGDDQCEFTNGNGDNCPVHNGGCICSKHWVDGEPKPCAEGSQCVRLLPDIRKIDNDVDCDDTLSAVLCNPIDSRTSQVFADDSVLTRRRRLQLIDNANQKNVYWNFVYMIGTVIFILV